MLGGLIYALLAGIFWGLIFVGPVIVPDYPAALQSTGRYLALGLIALPIAWLGRQRLASLSRQDWLTAFWLSTFGNLLYYLFLASAIQRTGAPITTMIIGTLPVIIPIFANLLYNQQEGRIPWRRLAPAMIAIILGMLMVNTAELAQETQQIDWARFIGGLILALLSVVCWAWYALRNARWLRDNPDKHPMMWATAQGLATLPLSFIGYLVVCLWLHQGDADFALPFGPRPGVFITLMLAIAILCSWLGNLCWNMASQRLPTVILGPLVVCETLTGLAYTFVLRQSLPPWLTFEGILFLIAGVTLALTAKLSPAPQPKAGPAKK